jgi:hypothetical protein
MGKAGIQRHNGPVAQSQFTQRRIMPMSPYKCPVCGRTNIDMPELEPTSFQAGTLTIAATQVEAHCRDCGWTGSVADLKLGY